MLSDVKHSNKTIYRCRVVAARGGRSSRDIGSKPIAGIVKLDAINAAILIISFYRHGAAEARGAHNSEDIGSKPIAGIIQQLASVHQGTSANHQTIQNEKSGSETLNRVGIGSSEVFEKFCESSYSHTYSVHNTF